MVWEGVEFLAGQLRHANELRTNYDTEQTARVWGCDSSAAKRADTNQIPQIQQ